MVWFGNKKKNKNTKDAVQNSDWNKDLKRNIFNKENAKQQGFDFKENVDLITYKNTKGTKRGLSISVANLSQAQIEILKKCQHENTAADLIKILTRTNKTKFKQTILNPLIENGFFELTIPEKPTSPKQKYRLTGQFVRKST